MSLLRYGNVCALYYRHAKVRMPSQLDLLYEWFGNLLIQIKDTDGNTKKKPEFDERECMIHAVRYHGKLYTGGDMIISQLCGRLIGTAKGNREKQRKNAVLLQKRAVRSLHENYALIEGLMADIEEKLMALDEEAFPEFGKDILDFIIDCAYERAESTAAEIDGEPFPMDDEIFDTVIYNAAYQFTLYTMEGIVNAYLWLLIGSLFRNEAGRLTRRFDSSFIEVNRAPSEDPSLISKLDYLLFPEDYEYTYEGDDVTSRFPDIVWKCDECGAVLNDQQGFDERIGLWQCRVCNHINQLDIANIYDCDEDARNGRNQNDEQKFRDAIERRKQELEQNKD